jgi:cell division control protein 6
MYKQNIFENRVAKAESIFKDEQVFYPNYFPENIKARDKEIQEISYSLKPITENKRARNLIIFGPPGTGKTLISNFVLKQLMEYTQKVKCLYINAIEDNTRFALYSKILMSMYSVPIPRRGLGIDELLNRLKEEVKKSEKFPILIIDEVDKLSKEEISEILYDLSRFEINHKYITLILITNHKEFLVNLDSRTQSTLFLTDLEFKKYSPKDLKEILIERIEYGLIKNAISLDLIGYITGYAAKNGGDARIAIDLLYKSAKYAEKIGVLEITKEIVLESGKLIDSVKLLEKLNYLDNKQKEILLAIPEKGIESGKLYELFEDSDRTIRRHLEFLEEIGLVKINQINTQKGRKRNIEITFNKELLK